ncbi:MAG: FtsX-like permease family protein [Sedimenticolaceae bacterium]
MNVMLVAVSQRTSEIGLLKALGSRNNDILLLFMVERPALSCRRTVRCCHSLWGRLAA